MKLKKNAAKDGSTGKLFINAYFDVDFTFIKRKSRLKLFFKKINCFSFTIVFQGI